MGFWGLWATDFLRTRDYAGRDSVYFVALILSVGMHFIPNLWIEEDANVLLMRLSAVGNLRAHISIEFFSYGVSFPKLKYQYEDIGTQKYIYYEITFHELFMVKPKN
ncbi:hypothetical protein ACJX0J_021609, partial [Zea mays]